MNKSRSEIHYKWLINPVDIVYLDFQQAFNSVSPKAFKDNKQPWGKREDLCMDERLVKSQEMAGRRILCIFAMERGHWWNSAGTCGGSKAVQDIPKWRGKESEQ